MPPKDKDKKDKKEKPKGWNFDTVEFLIVILFILSIAGTLVPAIIRYITSGEISFFGFRLAVIVDFFRAHILFFKSLGFSIAGIAAIGTFVLTKKGDAVWREEKAKLYPANMTRGIPSSTPEENNMRGKWEKIVEKSESQNSSDWRLAIIEADIMLDDLLMQLQLPGETMGDKLKAVEPSDFLTLDLAWEAHKARNAIAHEGSDFLINQREVRRIISLYGAVFKEFGLI